MCGFIGAFGPSALNLKDNLEAATAVIAHRGPDSNGTYINPNHNLVLGHTRLSILDLSENGHQPFINGKDVLVYNGEVYNHKEFRNTKYQYSSASDTETILKLGNGLKEKVENFIGMYAGAMWLDESNELLLFRDNMGIKPLHYALSNDGTVIFSSDERALFKLINNFQVTVNRNYLRYLLAFENFPQGQSLFSEINSVLPGQILTFKKSTNANPQFSSSHHDFNSDLQVEKDYSKIIRQVSSEIRDSVRLHLLSDVPIAVYLSGGIDSSLVATLAARESGYKITGFSGYFEESQEFDERSVSELVAKQAGIEYVPVKISSFDFIEELDNLIFHLGQPRMGFGSFSQSLVAKKVSKSHKVVLSGHGGDELFWGYPYMGAVLSLLGQDIPLSKNGALFKIYLRWRKLTGQPLFMAPMIWDIENINSSDFEFSLSNKDCLTTLKKYYQEVYIQGLLAVEDKVSMGHSLETRMPLWSQRIKSLANQIKPEDHFKNGPKSILREVAKAYLPAEVFFAPKRGFPTPFRLWLRNEIFDFTFARISRDSDVLDIVMPKNERQKMLTDYKKIPSISFHDEKRAHKIWILLMLESWERQFKVGVV